MRRRKGQEKSKRTRPVAQGGGPYAKPAPKVRRKRNRAAGAVAKQARKVNR